jgi:uncharacterized Zn finger protein (UPF0148 family)
MSIFCPHCDTYLMQDEGNLCPNCHRPLRELDVNPAHAMATEKTIAKLAADDDKAASTPAKPQYTEEQDFLRDRIRVLERRIAYLEERGGHTNLMSNSFLARAFAVWGHFVIAHILIVAPLFLVMCFLGFLKRGALP